MKKYYGFIYKTTCLIDNSFYVGKRVKNSKSKDEWYLGSGTVIKNKIKKYGKDNFIKEVLEYCFTDHDDLKDMEIKWINKLDAKNRDIGGMNITDGGNDGWSIQNHPNLKNIIKKRVSSWKKTYQKDKELQRKRKKQLDEARLLRTNTKSKQKKKVVELSIKDNKIINIYDSLTECEKINKISGLSSAIKRNGLCCKRYFQFFNKNGIYKKYEKPKIVYKKGIRNSIKTEFKKGNKPWCAGLSGTGVLKANKTSFKKGNTPWNKGKKWSKNTGKNHPTSKTIECLDLKNNKKIVFYSVIEASIETGISANRIYRSLRNIDGRVVDGFHFKNKTK